MTRGGARLIHGLQKQTNKRKTRKQNLNIHTCLTAILPLQNTSNIIMQWGFFCFHKVLKKVLKIWQKYFEQEKQTNKSKQTNKRKPCFTNLIPYLTEKKEPCHQACPQWFKQSAILHDFQKNWGKRTQKLPPLPPLACNQW